MTAKNTYVRHGRVEPDGALWTILQTTCAMN